MTAVTARTQADSIPHLRSGVPREVIFVADDIQRSLPLGALMLNAGAFAVPVALGCLFAPALWPILAVQVAAIVVVPVARRWERAVVVS